MKSVSINFIVRQQFYFTLFTFTAYQNRLIFIFGIVEYSLSNLRTVLGH